MYNKVMVPYNFVGKNIENYIFIVSLVNISTQFRHKLENFHVGLDNLLLAANDCGS